MTKVAAESLCQLFQHRFGLPCIVLRASRFFRAEGDDAQVRRRYQDDNLKGYHTESFAAGPCPTD